MPLVSIVPGVILMMGGGFWLSLTIAVLAGISAAPVGSYIAKRLPPFVPGAVGFVSGMAVVTILLSAVLHTFDIFIVNKKKRMTIRFFLIDQSPFYPYS